MADAYYKPCAEFDKCNELIETYFETKQYEKCFKGHYEEGIGVEADLEKAKEWYRKAALQKHDLALEKCKELHIEL